MKLKDSIFVVILVVAFCNVSSYGIVIPVNSMFGADIEGWTSNTPSEINWESTGGNPDGYLKFVDTSGDGTYVYAPVKFLGDWSSLNGVGLLSFDHKIFDTGNIGLVNPYTVNIFGPSGTGTEATWLGDTPPEEPTEWFTVTVPLDASVWSKTGSWETLLSNVTKLEIRMELYNNIGTDKDEVGLDNVELVPEPAGPCPSGKVDLGDLSLYVEGETPPSGWASILAEYPKMWLILDPNSEHCGYPQVRMYERLYGRGDSISSIQNWTVRFWLEFLRKQDSTELRELQLSEGPIWARGYMKFKGDQIIYDAAIVYTVESEYNGNVYKERRKAKGSRQRTMSKREAEARTKAAVNFINVLDISFSNAVTELIHREIDTDFNPQLIDYYEALGCCEAPIVPSITWYNNSNYIIYFADPNLKAAVEEELDIPEPNATDLLALTYFGAVEKGIADLGGLEYATDLTVLWMWDNEISNISALYELTNLTDLDLSGNQISDILCLSGLGNLKWLDLSENQIRDISALSGLESLMCLDLSDNLISDISVLSGLTNLKLLCLNGNPLNSAAYSTYIPMIIANNPGIDILYELPELLVTSEDITFVPDSPVEPNTIVVVSAEVHNIGIQELGIFIVRFFNGDPNSGGIQIGGDQEITSLAGGASEVASVAFTTSPERQSYEIFILVDAAFQIEEVNEANNKAFSILTAGPDLVLTSSDISFSAEVAGEVRMTVEVHNVGTADITESIEVAFYNGDPETGGTYIGDATIIGGIAEGLSGIVEYAEWSNPPLGTYDIYVVVDPEGEITETTKANNKAFNILSATLDLTLISEDISFNPELAIVGQEIEISASIHNNGFLPCEEFVVKFYDGDPDAGGTELGAEIIDEIAGLGLVQVSILSTFTSGWKHEIYVVADADNEVEETNEDNNLTSNNLYVCREYGTIQEAIDGASPGDTVYIGPETYNENVLINKSITLIGAGAATTVIDGNGIGDVVLVTADNVTIKGFTVQNSVGDGSGFHLKANSATVSENIITQCYYGIFCDYSSGSYIAYNTVTVNSYGIYCEYASGDAIRYNTITNNTLYGAKSYNSDLANCFNYNYFSGNPVGYSYDPEEPVGPLLFGDNVLQDNRIGVEVKDTSASDLEFSDNTIVGSDIGIFCENANPLIRDNSLSSNKTAMYLVDSSSPTIVENTISENTTGIVHDESSEPILEDNTMVGNVEDVTTIPVADAGGPYIAQASSWSGASIVLDGTASSDPDGDALTYEWDLDLSWDSDSDGDLTNDADETEPTSTWLFPIGQTEILLVVTDEYGVRSEPDVTTVTVSIIDVGIDIKPGSFPNSINIGSHGVIPVAFLTDEQFDASTIDPATVTLRGEDFTDGLVKLRGKKDAPVPMSNLEDINGDGDLDLVVHLETEKLAEYELEAICEIGALTFDGYVVSGTDTINIVPE